MNFLNVHLGPYHALPAASNTKFTDHLKPRKRNNKSKKKSNMNKQSEPYHADNYVLKNESQSVLVCTVCR